MKKSRRVVVITGPTAAGKSSLGIELAKEFNGEIISADSRQVYQRMDLGTGKVKTTPLKNLNPQEKRLGKCFSDGIVHYLLDVADPRKEQFNMAQFQRLAHQALELIFSSGKTPFLVGGTMLYIDALIKGFKPSAPPDPKLRAQLKEKTIKELLSLLKGLDPKTYEIIDKQNRYRITRAIEVKKLTDKSFFSSQKQIRPDFKPLILVISCPRKELYRRIDQRVDQRIDWGMIKEIQDLHDWGLSWSQMERFGLEYRYLSQYLRGRLSKSQAVEKLKNQTHGYARRQLSWWRQNREAHWIKSLSQARKLTQDFLSS